MEKLTLGNIALIAILFPIALISSIILIAYVLSEFFGYLFNRWK